MMALSPFRLRDTIGLVFHRGSSTDESDGATPEFLGSCFSLWDEDYFLTAEHCVDEHDSNDLFVLSRSGGMTQQRPVRWISRHDEADVAILRCEEMGWGEGTGHPFTTIRARQNLPLGEPFYAFGFPTDSLRLDEEDGPTARLFRSHFQRFLWHKSHMGYEYRAGEMSIPAPEGLSGGPVFPYGGDKVEVFGLVAENLEAKRVLHRESFKNGEDGAPAREEYRVISYGVCVLLDPISDWLQSQILRGV